MVHVSFLLQGSLLSILGVSVRAWLGIAHHKQDDMNKYRVLLQLIMSVAGADGFPRGRLIMTMVVVVVVVCISYISWRMERLFRDLRVTIAHDCRESEDSTISSPLFSARVWQSC